MRSLPPQRGEAKHATLLCGDRGTVFRAFSDPGIGVFLEDMRENGAAQAAGLGPPLSEPLSVMFGGRAGPWRALHPSPLCLPDIRD
ncbi:MAG TPA: hypothetical protein VFG55_05065 [Rhodanobacteraceae bacterium]|nr:hypothetical protein [Rhodanobacteraceae bacterium]